MGGAPAMNAVFLDTAPLIYLIEGAPALRSSVRDRLAEWIEEGVRLRTSVLTLTELLIPASRVRDHQRVFQYKSALHELLDGPLHAIDETQAEKAAEIRARYSFSTPDALQLAAALSMGCERFFTNDRALRRFKALEMVLVAA